MIATTSLIAFALSFLSVRAQEREAPPELGTLRYSRDLDATLAKQTKANKDGKPIFVVFQEIPG